MLGSNTFIPGFEEQLIGLKAGDVSAPVKTDFGWHVIKLEETRKKDAPALDEVKDELASEIQRTTIDALIETLSKDAKVDRTGSESIDPELLGNTDILEN